MVCGKFDAERKIESYERIFQNLGETILLKFVVFKIIGRFVVQTSGQTVERQIKADVVAQRKEDAELEIGQIETVVERNANSAVKIGACKTDLNVVLHFAIVVVEVVVIVLFSAERFVRGESCGLYVFAGCDIEPIFAVGSRIVLAAAAVVRIILTALFVILRCGLRALCNVLIGFDIEPILAVVGRFNQIILAAQRIVGGCGLRVLCDVLFRCNIIPMRAVFFGGFGISVV